MFKVFGDSISGNCLKVAYVADFLGLDYEWYEVSVLAGDAKKTNFLSLNPAGQFPIVQFPDGRTLAQSNAIMRYLAADSRLIPSAPWFAAKMDEWLFWEQYSHETAIAVARFQVRFKGVPIEELANNLIIKGNAALFLMESHLTGRNWFVGNDITLADIALYAYTQFAEEGGFTLDDKPNIKSWLTSTKEALVL